MESGHKKLHESHLRFSILNSHKGIKLLAKFLEGDAFLLNCSIIIAGLGQKSNWMNDHFLNNFFNEQKGFCRN